MAHFKKKKILFVFMTILIIYLFWLGYHLISFRAYTLPPDQVTFDEIVGAYHIHTNLSDGQKSPDKVTQIAAQKSLDFIILADHGSPNYQSLQSQGWVAGVLVLAGSELSVNRGHLVALDFEGHEHPFSQIAEDAASQIHKAQGISIIAHPYSKTHWTWGEYSDYSGIEVFNADSLMKKNFFSLLPYLPLMIVKPELPLIKLLKYPSRNFQKWDNLNLHHKVYGYFSTDAHMLYGTLFSYFHLHLLVKKPLPQDFSEARSQVFEALKQGRFYNAVNVAAPAQGFRFFAQKGTEKIPMGSSLALDFPVTLGVISPSLFRREVHLLHDGKIVLKSDQEDIIYQAAAPGTYRVEVFLREKTPLSQNCPWIVSNPIFLKEKTP